MNHIKNNIYYKKLRRWFKVRKKNVANRVIYFRKPLFYLRPIRLWLINIIVRYNGSPWSSPRPRTRATGQRYNRSIKRNRQRLLHSQLPEGGSQCNPSVGESPHSRSYQEGNRKTILPNKNQWQRISCSSKQQYLYRREFIRLLYYVSKNTPLTGTLPFLGMMLKTAVMEESSRSNLIITMRYNEQKVAYYYPIGYLKTRKVKIVQEFQLERKEWHKSKDQENHRTKKEGNSKEDTQKVVNIRKKLKKTDNEVWNNMKDPDYGSKDFGVESYRNERVCNWGTRRGPFFEKKYSGSCNKERFDYKKDINKPDNEWGFMDIEKIKKHQDPPKPKDVVHTCSSSNIASYMALDEKLTGTGSWSSSKFIDTIPHSSWGSTENISHIRQNNYRVTEAWPSI